MAANTQNLKIVIDAVNNTDRAFKDVQNQVQSVGGTMDGLRGSVERMQPAFQKMAAVGGAALAGITLYAKSAIQAANEQEVAQARLTQILRTSVDATDEQIASLMAQADALERVGVVSEDVTMAAQGTLATFDLQADSINQLIPAFLNMMVAERGVNATTDDAIGLANGLGKVLQGQVGALSKQGFVFDEATEAILKHGTEQEKVAALAEILDSTYAGLNETMRGTTEGAMKGMQMQLGKINEEIGKSLQPAILRLVEALTPLIEKVTTWIQQNPDLAAKIILVTGALAGLLTVVGLLGIAIPAITAGFAALFSPITLVIVAIGAIGFAIYKLIENWDLVSAKAAEIWQVVVDTFNGIRDAITGVLSAIGDAITGALQAYVDMWMMQFNAIKDFVTTIMYFIVGVIAMVLDAFFPEWQAKLSALGEAFVAAWDSIKATAAAVAETLGAAWDWLIGKITGFLEAVKFVYTAIKDILFGNQQDFLYAHEYLTQTLGSMGARLSLFLQTVRTVFTAIRDVIVSVWNAVGSAFNAAKQGIADAINYVLDKVEPMLATLEKITNAAKKAATAIKDAFNSAVEKGKSVIGKKASGGAVSANQPYMVGENGAELFMPSTAGSIIPNSRLAGVGGGTFVVNITGNTFADEDDFAERVGDRIVRLVQNNVRI